MFPLFNSPTLYNFDFDSLNFFRRLDLTPEMRLDIAYAALTGNWGTVTALAEKYGISRCFIYQLKNQLFKVIQKAFGAKEKIKKNTITKDILTFVLSLRLEAKSSIIPLSHIMKRFGFVKYNSVGSISQILNYCGSRLPNTLDQCEYAVKLVIASDEIFSHFKPILITVDPISSVILKMELAESRDVDQWKKHWECIKNNDFYAAYLVNDEGISMAAAQKEVFPDITRQADTFHGVAHRLGLWEARYWNAVENAIKSEEKIYKRLDSAKSNQVINKIIAKYEATNKKTNEAIMVFENFHFLYLELISNLQIFNKKGQLNDRTAAEENVLIILELMKEFKNEKLLKETRSIKNLLSELFPFLDEAKKIFYRLRQLDISEDHLKLFCLAWQYNKNNIKAKDSQRKKYYKKEEERKLFFLKHVIPHNFDNLKKKIYNELDGIIQSSALVENINSIVRMYLNTTKNHINQNFLNLIMFYLNHRRFADGKRKNKTPMEIFTGKPQEKDWLEMLLEKVPWQEYNF